MSYSASYKDENGAVRKVSITNEDSREALKNDYEEIMRRYNPNYVSIKRVRANAGEAMHLTVTVNAPSHYLTAINDTKPKECLLTTADIICYPGYPLKSVKASYPKNHYLASPNVFRGGNACIDTWIPFTSSLTTVVDKLVHDIIHDPSVTRYDSMANNSMEIWHKENVLMGRFPTIPPAVLYTPEYSQIRPAARTALPRRKPAALTPPPLPARSRRR